MDKNEAESVIKNTIEYANNEIKKNRAKARKTIVIIISIAAILIIWITMGFVDYFRVSNFEKPIFCISKESVSSDTVDFIHCQGLGYSFEIAVNDPLDEYPGVTSYTYFLFGNEICSAVRD